MGYYHRDDIWHAEWLFAADLDPAALVAVKSPADGDILGIIADVVRGS